MANKILITGASGLIGTRLTELLQKENPEVAHLVRSVKKSLVQTFLWNPEANRIDPQALKNVNTIIHLAGSGIAEKRWSAKRKKEILNSRVLSTRLLADVLQKENHPVETIVSASAIGYYGPGDDQKIFTEDDSPGSDFLAQVTRQWEQEVEQFQSLNIRVVKIRIGIVLSTKGGALKEMARPVRLGLGAPLGSGQQYMSWIHIDDLCHIFKQALNDKNMQGIYNGVTDWCTNAELTKALAKILHKPLWLPSVPSFVLKIALGEMADLVLKGNKVSSEKIRNEGFVFRYPQLNDALTELLGSKQ